MGDKLVAVMYLPSCNIQGLNYTRGPASVSIFVPFFLWCGWGSMLVAGCRADTPTHRHQLWKVSLQKKNVNPCVFNISGIHFLHNFLLLFTFFFFMKSLDILHISCFVRNKVTKIIKFVYKNIFLFVKHQTNTNLHLHPFFKT